MRQFLRRRAGQSMVEFAVLAPVFFLLLLGTIDLGRAVYTYNAISNAASAKTPPASSQAEPRSESEDAELNVRSGTHRSPARMPVP